MRAALALPDAVRRLNLGAIWFAARINIYAIALTALWTPLNTLVLPDQMRAVAPAALRGSALGLIT